MNLETQLENLPHSELVINKYLESRYSDSLYDFARVGLGYSSITQRTHRDVISVLESTATRKLIVLPRGTFKSTIADISYSHWRLNKKPNLRIMLCSELVTNAETYLREIKGNMQRSNITKIYGDYKTKIWNSSEIVISQRTVTRKEASIFCSGLGTTKVGMHPDLIILDDMNSDSNSQNPDARKKIIDYYKMLQAILEPGGEIVVIGTRYAEDDLIGHILKNEVDLKVT